MSSLTKPVIPTLSAEGWDTSPLAQMSKLWEYYQSSDFSQSNMFLGGVSSLKHTLQKDIDPIVLKQNIEKDIFNLYGSYFEEVKPLIEIEELGNNTVRIICQISVKRENEQYLLSRAIKGTGAGVIEYETKLTNLAKYRK